MTKEKKEGQNHGVNLSRRFLVKAAVGTAIVGTTIGISKKVISESLQESLDKSYIKDEIQQTRTMAGKEYVLMSQEDKKDFINVVINNYKYEG